MLSEGLEKIDSIIKDNKILWETEYEKTEDFLEVPDDYVRKYHWWADAVWRGDWYDLTCEIGYPKDMPEDKLKKIANEILTIEPNHVVGLTLLEGFHTKAA